MCVSPKIIFFQLQFFLTFFCQRFKLAFFLYSKMTKRRLPFSRHLLDRFPPSNLSHLCEDDKIHFHRDISTVRLNLRDPTRNLWVDHTDSQIQKLIEEPVRVGETSDQRIERLKTFHVNPSPIKFADSSPIENGTPIY